MPRRPQWIGLISLAVVATAALLLRSVDAPAARGAVPITVKAGEWFFEPQVLTVDSATEVSVTLEHMGSAMIPHDIVFELADGQTAASERILGGQTDRLGFVTPARSGAYAFYCSVGNHRQRGMEGRLVVLGPVHLPRLSVSGREEPYWPPTPATARPSPTVIPSPPTATSTTTPITPSPSPTPSVSRTSTETPLPPTDVPTLPPVTCERPLMICPPGGGTSTPIPGDGTPIICPTCRRR